MTHIVRVLTTALWQSHPYRKCPNECWEHMFPVIPPDTNAVRLLNLRDTQAGKGVLPIRFVNAPDNCGYILIQDGKTRPSFERHAYRDTYAMIPPDHPQFDYLDTWMKRAGELAHLHAQVVNRLARLATTKSSPVRTLRKEWGFLADMLAKHPTSKHQLMREITPDAEHPLPSTIKDEYESIIAKGLLMPQIDYRNTVAHSSNIGPVLDF